MFVTEQNVRQVKRRFQTTFCNSVCSDPELPLQALHVPTGLEMEKCANCIPVQRGFPGPAISCQSCSRGSLKAEVRSAICAICKTFRRRQHQRGAEFETFRVAVCGCFYQQSCKLQDTILR